MVILSLESAKKFSKEALALVMKEYDCLGYFSKGLIDVSKDGKYFHIRPDGKPAYEERYDDAGYFNDGRAWVRKDDKCFFIRPNGKRADS